MNTFTEEDHTAAKLKGYNCLVKFHDGEVLFLRSESLEYDDPTDWLIEAEDYINGKDSNFPDPTLAVDRKSIKYVRLL